jgi:DNA-binding MarR family transcriptional regulator
VAAKKAVNIELVRALGEELGRELSARTVLFHQAVADRLGLNITDHKCLDIAHRAGPDGQVTAGQLAELTGLSTGAITGVLDRLEKAGFIRREKDPNDRRQVIVRMMPTREREIQALFEPLARAWAELCSRYQEEELVLIQDFMRKAGALVQEETARLRAAGMETEEATTDAPHVLSAPLGRAKRGVLELTRGAADLTLGVTTSNVLYRARCEGPPLKIEVRDGRVSVAYTRKFFDFRRQKATIELHARIPWTIQLTGGASDVTGDLRELQLAGFEITGGASDVALRLPPPVGTVTVRITGGVSDVRILRPDGVPVRTQVGAGASGLVIDTLQLGSVGGEMRWESPDFAAAEDRYELKVLGGASNLTIATESLAPRRG